MRHLRTLTALFMIAASLVPHASHADAVVVAHDVADDWGVNFAGDSSIAPIGDALGQELIGAAIENDAPGHVNFIIQLKSLPPTGGVPELSRYFWDFTVDGKLRELDGKFTNYTRGVCDPTSGQCPPPRDPGPQPFLVRGNCASNGAAVICEEIGLVAATFDPTAATITIPVTTELLGLSGCGEITPADDGFSGSLTAVPSAFLSEPAGPWDSLLFDDEVESVTVC